MLFIPKNLINKTHMTAGRKMPNPRRKVIKLSGSLTITDSRNSS